MLDPLTLLLVGAGIVTYREINRKDYGVLTPSRDERYRNVMEHCYDSEQLIQESQLFAEYGLKAQAAMLKRRAEWRSRSEETKKAHEEIYQKALKSKNIPAILEIAQAFEGWTATKKASNLREHVHALQEQQLQEAAQKAANSTYKKTNGASTSEPVTELVNPPTYTSDDT